MIYHIHPLWETIVDYAAFIFFGLLFPERFCAFYHVICSKLAFFAVIQHYLRGLGQIFHKPRCIAVFHCIGLTVSTNAGYASKYLHLRLVTFRLVTAEL